MLKITHEMFKATKKASNPVLEEFVHSFDEAIEHNRELESLLSKSQVCVNGINICGKIMV